MDTNITVQGDLHFHQAGATAQELQAINRRLDAIAMDLTQATAELTALVAQVTKIGDETTTLLQKIADLEASIGAGVVTTPEFDAALAALKTQASVVDGLVPDEPPAPAPPAPPRPPPVPV